VKGRRLPVRSLPASVSAVGWLCLARRRVPKIVARRSLLLAASWSGDQSNASKPQHPTAVTMKNFMLRGRFLAA